MIRHYVLALNGSVQNLLTAAGPAVGGNDGPVPGSKAAATIDVPLRSVSLQPRGTNNAVIYVGGVDGAKAATVSSTNYGVRLEAGDTNDVPPAPFMYDGYESGAMKLSDFNVIGTNGEFLHIQVVVY